MLCAMFKIHGEAIYTTYPLMSSNLVCIAVIPASSSEAERLFSAMKRLIYKTVYLLLN